MFSVVISILFDWVNRAIFGFWLKEVGYYMALDNGSDFYISLEAEVHPFPYVTVLPTT